MGVSILHGWISCRSVIKDFVACVHQSLSRPGRSKLNFTGLYEPDRASMELRPRVELLEARSGLS